MISRWKKKPKILGFCSKKLEYNCWIFILRLFSIYPSTCFTNDWNSFETDLYFPSILCIDSCEFMEVMVDPSRFGMAKSLFTAGQSAGFDMRNEKEMSTFFTLYNDSLMADMIDDQGRKSGPVDRKKKDKAKEKRKRKAAKAARKRGRRRKR